MNGRSWSRVCTSTRKGPISCSRNSFCASAATAANQGAGTARTDSGAIGGLMFRTKIRLSELHLFGLAQHVFDVDQQIHLIAVWHDADQELAADAAHDGRRREEGVRRQD